MNSWAKKQEGRLAATNTGLLVFLQSSELVLDGEMIRRLWRARTVVGGKWSGFDPIIIDKKHAARAFR